MFKRIKASQEAGQRSFIVVVAEGLGGEFSEGLVKEIEENTGVETRFVRPAHIVRGGTPTLRDRSLASVMGDKAVDLLLQGQSDVVICSRNDKIVSTEIKWALIVDRMFKGKLKDGDLDKFSEEEVNKMKELCAERRKYFEDMYDVMLTIGC
jgi:6-phosphofructokinase 1